MLTQSNRNEQVNRLDSLIKRKCPEVPVQQATHPGTSLCHIRWMLSMMGSFVDDGKFNRWLGYVQGILVMEGITDLDTERDTIRQMVSEEDSVLDTVPLAEFLKPSLDTVFPLPPTALILVKGTKQRTEQFMEKVVNILPDEQADLHVHDMTWSEINDRSNGRLTALILGPSLVSDFDAHCDLLRKTRISCQINKKTCFVLFQVENMSRFHEPFMLSQEADAVIDVSTDAKYPLVTKLRTTNKKTPFRLLLE